MPATARHTRSGSFTRKLGGTLLLLILAHVLFYGQEIGATLGGFALAWCAVLAAAVPALRRRTPAVALGCAAGLALVLVDDPNPLGWVLFWSALATAILLPRQRFHDAATWAVRLLGYGFIGLASAVRDAVRVMRRRSRRGATVGSVAAVLALPLLGGGLFLALFAVANPVIGTALAAIKLPSFWDALFHLLFWATMLAIVWPAFRPRAPGFTGGLIRESEQALDLPVTTLMLSLAAFNAVFALQNALDLAFLWSGAPLPAGVTLADYAHRGAYTLIATALLAGGFVLVALAPGSRAARSRTVRQLLVLWIAQNIFLVASSILRLLDYIAAYSLTELRIAALAWMALVAIGLVLICWRLLNRRTAAWLVNANAAMAGLVLVAADMIDLGAVAARWNVTHARHAEQLDLCYLGLLGPSALLPLTDLERRASGPILRDRARYLRRTIQNDLAARQEDWHQWTPRNARRLAATSAVVGSDTSALRSAPHGRACDGSILPPPPQEPSSESTGGPSLVAPLTRGAVR